MALSNFTLAGVAAATPALIPSTQAPLHLEFDDLLYSPVDQKPDYSTHHTANEPFKPPANLNRRNKLRKRAGTAYLPPPNQYAHYPRHENIPQNPYSNQLHTQVYQQNSRVDFQIENQRVHELHSQYDNSGQYTHDPSGDYDVEQRRIGQVNDPQQIYNRGYPEPPYPPATPPSPRKFENNHNAQPLNYNFAPGPVIPPAPAPLPQLKPQVANTKTNVNKSGSRGTSNNQTPPVRPSGFTKVETGSSGGKTQLHAVLDYDDEYYDDVPGQTAVTPLQGPILLRNGSVPVVPLTSYPTINNGSFYQIPIMWTALSLALGYELQGQIIKGVPCVKRNYQLYCPTAGNTYPLEKIEAFIDDNKALIKRMYGSFSTPEGTRVRRAPGVPDMHAGDSYFRHVRQTASNPIANEASINNTGRIDACESKTEILTPYWALNSAKKLRAIVNTMHFEQAIHQELCSNNTTSRCSNNCGCEQKYKWHRLLAYDPSDDCAGIFMDWFLFPSCCVCRCDP